MADAKATTIQQRFGFNDEELKTAGHDEIIIWLYNNVERLVAPYMMSIFRDSMKECGVDRAPDGTDESVKAITKSLEYAISDRNYIIGFIDFVARAEGPILNEYEMEEYVYSLDYYNSIAASRKPLMPGEQKQDNMLYRGGKKKVTSIHAGRHSEEFYFEVKTSIPSLGELLRQINMYRKYKPGTYFVVCPDDRFKDMLFEQGVRFIKYDAKG